MAGSLIEFHQRYVFHKNADMWKVQATQVKSDDKKSLKLFENSAIKITWSDFLTRFVKTGLI